MRCKILVHPSADECWFTRRFCFGAGVAGTDDWQKYERRVLCFRDRRVQWRVLRFYKFRVTGKLLVLHVKRRTQSGEWENGKEGPLWIWQSRATCIKFKPSWKNFYELKEHKIEAKISGTALETPNFAAVIKCSFQSDMNGYLIKIRKINSIFESETLC